MSGVTTALAGCCCGSSAELDAESFPAPAVSSDSPDKAQIWSVGTQTYQPDVHTIKVYNALTTLTGNCPVELIFASVMFKNTFLDPHVNYMNTPTFFSVPAHRNDDFL